MTRKNFTKEEKQAYKENKKQQLKEIREELKKGVRNIYTTDNKENENGEIESQEGEQVPTLCNELIDKNNIEQLENFKNKIIETSTVPIEFREIYNDSNGFYTPTNNTITIKSNMSISHTIRTLIHETAHSILHNLDAINIKELSREDKEIQAESVAYCVCKYFGLDTSSYSFDYIATWSYSKTTQELEKNMKTIKDTTDLLIKRYEA